MKKKIHIFIYLLTIIDIVATVIGIKFDFIKEGNPLLEKIMTEFPFLVGFILSIIIGLILYWLYKQKIKWVMQLLFCVLFVKLGVVCMHFLWIFEYVLF
jgi:hypothetical protein